MNPKHEGNWYDKIFKENLEAVTPALVKKVLHIPVAHAEKLLPDIAQTIERKPDQLLRITDTTGQIFIVHLEFQVVDETEMIYRMLEYRALLSRKYKLDVYQYVLFLTDEAPQMVTQLTQRNLAFAFDLICFSELDYQIFLSSSQPEEVLLAILANFGDQSPQVVAQQLVSRLQETAEGQLALEKHLHQLRILANLRKLKPFIEQLMDAITKYFKPEEDFLYKKGISEGEQLGFEKGIELKKHQVIVRLLAKQSFTDEQIAEIAAVPVSIVNTLRETLHP